MGRSKQSPRPDGRGLSRPEPYFFAASAAGLAPSPPAVAAPAASVPSAAFSFLAFFSTILTTRTLGSPNGLRPSGHFSRSWSFLIRSARVSTLRLDEPPRRRFRDLSIDMECQRSEDRSQSGP